MQTVTCTVMSYRITVFFGAFIFANFREISPVVKIIMICENVDCPAPYILAYKFTNEFARGQTNAASDID